MDFEELLHRYRATSASVTKNKDVDQDVGQGVDQGVEGVGFEFPVMKVSVDEKEEDDKTVKDGKSKKVSATLLAKLLLERQNKNRLQKESELSSISAMESQSRRSVGGVEGKRDLSEEIEKNNRLLDSILKGGSSFTNPVVVESSLSGTNSHLRQTPKNLFIENEEVEPDVMKDHIVNNDNNNIYQPPPVMTIEEMLSNPEYPIPLSDSVTISEVRARVREEENQKYMSRREIEEKVKRCCEISEDIHLAVKNMQEHVYRLDIHFRFLRQIMAIDDSEIEAYIKEISLYPSPSNPEEEEEENQENLVEKLSSFKFVSASSSSESLPQPQPDVFEGEETIPVYEMEDDPVEEDVPVDLIDVVDGDDDGGIVEDQENQEENTEENNEDVPTTNQNSNVSIFAPLRAQVRPNGIFGNNNMKKFQTIY